MIFHEFGSMRPVRRFALMKKFLYSPPGLVLISLVTLVGCGWLFSLPTVDFVRSQHTQRVARELAASATEFDKGLPSRELAENYLKSLRAINPGYAQTEVRDALRVFVTAMTLEMTWDGKSDKSKEKVIRDAEVAGQNLKDAIRKHM
jgi:hypothetical protein